MTLIVPTCAMCKRPFERTAAPREGHEIGVFPLHQDVECPHCGARLRLWPDDQTTPQSRN